ncbi:hypothetical protein V6N13_088801 [Hibiscus sabdariffa]
MRVHFAGKDTTDDFEGVGHSDNARDMMAQYYVGEIDVSTIPEKIKYKPTNQPLYNQDKTSEFIIKLLQFLVPLDLGVSYQCSPLHQIILKKSLDCVPMTRQKSSFIYANL